MNLADQLDELVSTQPYADRPAAYYVAKGRRARTRRRVGVLGMGVATAAVIGLGSASLAELPQRPDDRSVGVTSQGLTATAQPPDAESTGAVVGDVDQWNMAQSGQAATYTLDGQVKVAQGWHVIERIESPWQHGTVYSDGQPVDRSVALALVKGPQVQWVLLDWESAGSGSSGATYDNDPAARGFTSLRAYVDVEMALHQTRSTDQLVAFGADGTLEPLNGVTVRQQAPMTMADGSNAVVARLQVLDSEWWVIATHSPSGPTYVPVIYPHEGDPDNLSGFADYVTDLVAQGRLG